MGPLGAQVSKLESLKSPVTTKVERGLIRISSFSWLSRSAISAGILDCALSAPRYKQNIMFILLYAY